MASSGIDEVSRLHFIERGSGAPILFLHGWPASGKVWNNQLESLSHDHHVLALDLPGFGDSPTMREPSMESFASVVRDFIDYRELDGVFLIGWSMGAGVVMSYCQNFGSHGLRAIGIVDDCPKLLPGDDWLPDVDTKFSYELIEAWRVLWEAGDRRAVIAAITMSEFKEPATHDANSEWMIEESMKADPAWALAAFFEVMDLDFRASLEEVDVPALLLYGEFSKLTTEANRDFMLRTIPDAELAVFHDSGHNPMIEEVEKFNKTVDTFARKVGAR